MADLLVALTGGIASGKSTVAGVFERLGAEVIDSDQIAREVVESGTKGAALIADSFGKDFFTDGELDRKKLAAVVFSDATKRTLLESILHPLIRESSNKLFESSDGIVIYQIPLLVESRSDYPFDAIITVEAEDQTRIQRLIETRSMTEQEAVVRISSQTDRASREEIADFVIDSDCSLVELEVQVNEVWTRLEEMRRQKLGFS